MIDGFGSTRMDLATNLHNEKKRSDQEVQDTVLEYILNRPSLLTSPICSSLVETVSRGKIPRSREDFEKFQIQFMRKCLKIVQDVKDPNLRQWLTQKISSTHLYDWEGIEEASQLVTLSQTLEDPLRFVDHIEMLIQTGKTRYLADPHLAPLLKKTLILEQLIESAASSSDKKFRRFVKEFIIRHHLRCKPMEKDRNIHWLHRQSGRDSPLLRFFQKVGVLDSQNNLRFDISSLNEPIQILQQLLKYESRLIEAPLDYRNLEDLDRQMQELALKKFTLLLEMYRTQNPSDSHLAKLHKMLENDFPLEQKLSELREELLNSAEYPKLQEVLTEIFCKDRKAINQLLEKQAKGEGRLGRLGVKQSMLWKIKESWNLEKSRHPGKDFLPYINSLCSQFHSRCGLDMHCSSLVRQFASFTILSEIFTDGLLEAIRELSLDPFYTDLVILAFKDKNMDLLFRVSDLISYQKYLRWATSLPEHNPLRRKVLELDRKYKEEKLTCVEKLEKSQFYLEMNSSAITFQQKIDAISALRWSELHRKSLIMAHLHTGLNIPNNKTLEVFVGKAEESKTQMESVKNYHTLEMQSLQENSPFKGYLQKRGFFSKEKTVLTSFLMDELLLLKEEFIKKMEYLLGMDLTKLSRSTETINDFASCVIIQRFQRDTYPHLSRKLQVLSDEIFNSAHLSNAEKIETLQKVSGNPEIIQALNEPIIPENIPQPALQAMYQRRTPGPSSPFLASLFRSMNVTVQPGESLEEHVIEASSFVQFVVNFFLKDSNSMGINVQDELGLQDVLQLDFRAAEAVIQKNIWAQYQKKLVGLPKSEKGVSDLLKIGPQIAIEQSRNSIETSTSLRPELQSELLNMLSFATKIEKIRDKIEETLLWLRNKAHLYHLPIPEEEFSIERTSYQKWLTIKNGLGLFLFHMKKRIEKEQLSSEYLSYLEATLFAQSLNSSDLLLSEIEEQMPDWCEHL